MNILKNEYEKDDLLKILLHSLKLKNIGFTLDDKKASINFFTRVDGVFKVNNAKVIKINTFCVFSLIVIHNNSETKAGTSVAKIIGLPLKINKKYFDAILEIFGSSFFDIIPFSNYKVALIIVGDKFFKNGKKENFSEVIEKKIAKFNNSNIVYKEISSEDTDKTQTSIGRAASCSDVLFVGLDASDNRAVISELVEKLKLNIPSVSLPLYPGSDTMLFYVSDKPLIILSEDIFSYKITALDVILPRIFTGEKLNLEEILKFSVGGLCHLCSICVYPFCSLGKF